MAGIALRCDRRMAVLLRPAVTANKPAIREELNTIGMGH
jgi:hypothetical protein